MQTVIDVDRTKLSSTMVYSEVYNMMVSPNNYTGKIAKRNGAFAYFEDPETRNNTLPVSLPMRRLAAHREWSLF